MSMSPRWSLVLVSLVALNSAVGCKKMKQQDAAADEATLAEVPKAESEKVTAPAVTPPEAPAAQAPEAASLKLDPSAQTAGISATQLTTKQTDAGLEVTAYVVFASAFSQGLSLRAYDENEAEVGRSEALTAKQAADSSTYLTFRFDPRMPAGRVKTYALWAPEGASEPAKTAPPPAPSPQRKPSSGLTAKNPPLGY